MSKALLISIGGISGSGFFGTWGITQATNASKNDGWKWLKLGTNAIVSKSQRTKGVAIKIPNENFVLRCEATKEGTTLGCKELKEQLTTVKALIKTPTGIKLKDYLRDNDQEWTKNGDCGTIDWKIEDGDQETNLLLFSKFLTRVYCFNEKIQKQSKELSSEFIRELSKRKEEIKSGNFIGGIFNTARMWDNIGKKLSGSEVEGSLKKFIKNEGEELTKWIEVLSKLSDKELNLKVGNDSRNKGNEKWLIIQKN